MKERVRGGLRRWRKGGGVILIYLNDLIEFGVLKDMEMVLG